MIPVFIVITNAGAVWFTRHPEVADAIGGTVFRLASLAKKQQFATVTGASAVVALNGSGSGNELT